MTVLEKYEKVWELYQKDTWINITSPLGKKALRILKDCWFHHPTMYYKGVVTTYSNEEILLINLLYKYYYDNKG